MKLINAPSVNICAGSLPVYAQKADCKWEERNNRPWKSNFHTTCAACEILSDFSCQLVGHHGCVLQNPALLWMKYTKWRKTVRYQHDNGKGPCQNSCGPLPLSPIQQSLSILSVWLRGASTPLQHNITLFMPLIQLLPIFATSSLVILYFLSYHQLRWLWHWTDIHVASHWGALHSLGVRLRLRSEAGLEVSTSKSPHRLKLGHRHLYTLLKVLFHCPCWKGHR